MTATISAELAIASELGLYECPFCHREVHHWYAMAYINEEFGWVCAICQSRAVAKLLGGVSKPKPPECDGCGRRVNRGQQSCYQCAAQRSISQKREMLKTAREDGFERFRTSLLGAGAYIEMLNRAIFRRLGPDAHRAWVSVISRTTALGDTVTLSYSQLADEWLTLESGAADSRTIAEMKAGLVALVDSGIVLRAGKRRNINCYELA